MSLYFVGFIWETTTRQDFGLGRKMKLTIDKIGGKIND